MGALRLLHEWAYTRKFTWWATETVIHSCMVFVLFAVWFGSGNPNVRTANGIIRCILAALVGGLLAFFIPFGFGLVITGQAFITSGVAALVYIAVSALAKDESRQAP